MDLSVVIVSWNTRELLRACLASLPAATAGLACEVTVVDNASADGSPEMVAAEFPSVQVLASGGNLGFARANNLALPRARGRHVLLLNPDTVCPPDALTRLVAYADAHPDLGGVGPRLVDGEGEPATSWGNFPAARFHWLWPRGLLGRSRWQFTALARPGEPNRPVPYVAGACLLIPSTALDAVGLLDERFFLYFEETDWCRRAWTAGRPIHLCTEVTVTHFEGKAAAQVSVFSATQFQHALRQYVAKHHGRAAVLNFRLALLWELAAKALLRLLVPGDRARNRQLAARYWLIARLQLQGRLDPRRPG